jgi:sarcosine oxidase, subunit beta
MSDERVVVVGGGTIGAWCAYFLQKAGRIVTLIEKDTLGSGASSRAAGIVRAQGGTTETVRLGLWTQEFYRSQVLELSIDSGFVETGYYMPCFTEPEMWAAKTRVAMQNEVGLESEWLEASDFEAANPTFARGRALGASYAPRDGYINPSRNVLAYTTALHREGVEVRENCAFTGLVTQGGELQAVATSQGELPASDIVLTGGPTLATVGELAGVQVWAGNARHQVVVTQPHPDLTAQQVPMVFDIMAGIYWRPEEDGLLWGMSNPDELPGEASEFDWNYFHKMRARLAELVPVTADLGIRRAWAATIDYTPDHLPIFAEILPKVWVASAAGHGMMWGPGVSRAAADLVLYGETQVLDVSSLGLDRFDESGQSRLDTDPIALPFPTAT